MNGRKDKSNEVYRIVTDKDYVDSVKTEQLERYQREKEMLEMYQKN